MTVPAGALLREDAWTLVGTGAEAGAAIGGAAQFVANVTPLWRADLTWLFRTWNTDWLAWEAWVSARRGRLVLDAIRPHADRVLWGAGFITFDGGITFDGDVGFDGLPTVLLAAAAAQFATEIAVSDGEEWFIPGRFFWLAGQMLRVIAVDGSTVEFQPPLRAAASAGAAISGDSTIDMVLAQADGGGLSRSALSPVAEVTATLVEAI